MSLRFQLCWENPSYVCLIIFTWSSGKVSDLWQRNEFFWPILQWESWMVVFYDCHLLKKILSCDFWTLYLLRFFIYSEVCKYFINMTSWITCNISDVCSLQVRRWYIITCNLDTAHLLEKLTVVWICWVVKHTWPVCFYFTNLSRIFFPPPESWVDIAALLAL